MVPDGHTSAESATATTSATTASPSYKFVISNSAARGSISGAGLPNDPRCRFPDHVDC